MEFSDEGLTNKPNQRYRLYKCVLHEEILEQTWIDRSGLRSSLVYEQLQAKSSRCVGCQSRKCFALAIRSEAPNTITSERIQYLSDTSCGISR